jgi:KRAB domain-containing zinc finger protein
MLEDVPWVATTADCWTAHNKSFLAMTVHWLCPKTRTRMRAVLACQRIIGSHTFDVLAEAMHDLHTKFGLKEKVRRTTTDNASNFGKAFSQFGKVCESLPQLEEERPDFNDDIREDMEQGAGVEVQDEFEEDPLPLSVLAQFEELDLSEDPEPLNVNSILDGQSWNRNSQRQKTLPPHMRCAAHSLNLIAAVDTEQAMEDEDFKNAYKSAMDKARGLWNAQCRSTISADNIKQDLGCKLVVPNVTRWNSTYDAVKVLNVLLTTKRNDA